MTDPTQTPTTPRTYMDSIAENPTGFLRTTEVWCVPKAIDPDPREAIVMKCDEPWTGRAYPADASFISKIVLAKGDHGEKMMFMAATGLHDILHLIEVLRTMDFNKMRWGMMSHAKAEFAAPAVAKHAYVIKAKPDQTDGKGKVTRRGDTEAIVLQPTNLVDTDGNMIMMEDQGHEGVEPDWVLNWSFINGKSGVHVTALTAGGKLLEMVIDRSLNRRYKNITPCGVFRVNDVVTIPRPNANVDYVIATSNGVMYRNNLVVGTSGHDICNLCYDTDTQVLWMRTRDNRVYRLWLEGGRFLTPEPWSNVAMLFEEAVSHKILSGSAIANPILTAWGKPREIMTKDPATNEDKGTGKFTVRYFRMEVARLIKPADSAKEDLDGTPATVC